VGRRSLLPYEGGAAGFAEAVEVLVAGQSSVQDDSAGGSALPTRWLPSHHSSSGRGYSTVGGAFEVAEGVSGELSGCWGGIWAFGIEGSWFKELLALRHNLLAHGGGDGEEMHCHSVFAATKHNGLAYDHTGRRRSL
jgi:hypothetical protein